jgi:SAM-dependent methyltransferase
MNVTETEMFASNKELWNKRTAIHLDSAFYNRQGFINGETILTPIELEELKDVAGKTMLHLQCHFGMDSLNWQRLGAKVTGVDFSEAAIAEAKKLNEQLGYNAEFVCSDIYSLLSSPSSSEVPINLEERAGVIPSPSPLERAGVRFGMGPFDIVFTSYGTIGWLPDLEKWAKVVATYLKPGGIFYMADFHPVVWMFDDNFTKIEYAYHKTEPIIVENQATYVENKEPIINKEYGWNHSISEILNSLLAQGLQLQFFNEHTYSPYSCFNNVVEFEKGKWHINGLEGKIPMVYSLMMRKKAP